MIYIIKNKGVGGCPKGTDVKNNICFRLWRPPKNHYGRFNRETRKNYSAYSPDLPGCIATGKTRSQVEKNMYSASRLMNTDQ